MSLRNCANCTYNHVSGAAEPCSSCVFVNGRYSEFVDAYAKPEEGRKDDRGEENQTPQMSWRGCDNCAYRELEEREEPCIYCLGSNLSGWTSITAKPEEGRKDDSGKDPWSLLPFDAVRAIVKVLAFGAGKYAPRNWEKGMDWHRPFDACLRHLTAWWGGEQADPETGMSHLWHAGCCILFLIAYEIRGIGKDDRPQKM